LKVVDAGVMDMSVLKTTQSGYVGYLKDQYTVLKETKDRMMATTITSTWK
jgi:urate oxidase